MRINLPRLPWLVSKHEGRFVTNKYSGSIGTDTSQGCISVLTFNYRVYVDISGGDENTFRLIAECFVIYPWNRGESKSDSEQAEFECSENGLMQAGEWLEMTASQHGF